MEGQRVVFTGPRQARLEPFEVPAPGPRQVLVRTTRTLVSAGTELKGYLGLDRGPHNRPYPLYPGYSHVGVVAAVGADVSEVQVGDRVATQRGHASHVLVNLDARAAGGRPARTGPAPVARGPEWLQRLPDGVTDEQATFAVLGSVAMHGVRKAGIRLDETCTIAGQGVVGQIVGQLARLHGARPVIGMDLVAERLALSRESGLDAQVDAGATDAATQVMAVTGGHGVDVAFDCTATTHAFPGLLQLAATEGRIVIVGSLVGTAEISLFDEIQLKELTIIGAFQPLAPTLPHPALPWTQAANRKAVLDLIATGRLRVDHLISHVSPASEAPALFELMGSGHRGWLGVIFQWS
ncbi:MAG: zinc-dependent alcohol dehydrogenase [Chloroflexota bacterium]